MKPGTHEWVLHSLIWFANGIAARFGGPVYLVGSALTSSTPRDYDVRCFLEDEDYVTHFGKQIDTHVVSDAGLAKWGPTLWSVCREDLRMSRKLSRHVGANVDVKFLHENERSRWLVEGQFRRLDEAPEGFFNAGRQS